MYVDCLLHGGFSSCRFAYVVFSDTETAEKVMTDKQGADLEGNALFLDYTGSRSSFKPRDRSFGDRSFGNRSFGNRSFNDSQDGGEQRKSQGLSWF